MQYFKHMGTMRYDKKLKNVISRYGLEGYGLYNLILESITEKLCNEKPDPDLEESCQELADYYNGDTTKINEMACFMVNEGLIELNEITNRIECRKIYKYLEQSQTRSDKIKKLIKAYKHNASKQLCLSETVSDCHSKNRTEQNRIEQNNSDVEYLFKLYPNYDNFNKRVIKNKEKDYPLLQELLTEFKKDDIANTIKKYLDNKDIKYVKQFHSFLDEFDTHYNNNKIQIPEKIEIPDKYKINTKEAWF